MRRFVSAESLLSGSLRSSGKQKEGKKLPKAGGRVTALAAPGEKPTSPADRAAQQISRMEAIGQLAGGIAHDFNNLLTVILGHSEFLLKRNEPAKSRRVRIEEIRKAAERGAWLTNQLLAYSRNQLLEPTVLQLNSVLEDMDNILRRVLGEDIALDLLLDPNLGWVKVDRGQLQQIVLNLAGNARDAMPQGGRLSIETKDVSVSRGAAKPKPFLAEGEYVAIVVRDSGHGMDAETRARIFEPFFTTKEMGKGTGLGLATVYGIVKQSGGCVWVESEPEKGARFEVYLPLVDEAAESAASEEIAVTPARRRKTVLIVEDEERVRELASEFVESAGYTVLTARDGKEALAIAERSDEPIHLLLTDVVMPNMRGPELAKRLKGLRTSLRIVYMSGYLEYNRGNEDFLDEGFFLQKPFSRDTLVYKVGEALRNNSRSRA